MTKEDFVKNVSIKRKQIEQVLSDLEKLKLQYLLDNNRPLVGDKVRITVAARDGWDPKEGRYSFVIEERTISAYVGRVKVKDNGEVRYSFLKCEKGGGPSKDSLLIIGQNYKVEKDDA